ncbi:shikimate kinase [Isoptericola croceus]|uniref:shikimate kinase n=1 Tax=Isoptericola croceus TaxID=3031406 RepID=UPI0023F6D3CA|nr:shikimate kinase [Isoptericola croceus]
MTSAPLLVLLGPAASGKSTLGALVAERLGRSFVDIDAAADPYYAEVGWSIDRLVERVRAVGRAAAEREWEPARAHAVRRVVEANPGAVVALGAGHASYTAERHREAVRAALRGVPHVVLPLPSLDRAVALTVLRHRSVMDKGTDWVFDGHDLLAEWFDDAGTRALATHTVTTSGRTPEDVAAEVAALIG